MALYFLTNIPSSILFSLKTKLSSFFFPFVSTLTFYEHQCDSTHFTYFLRRLLKGSRTEKYLSDSRSNRVKLGTGRVCGYVTVTEAEETN